MNTRSVNSAAGVILAAMQQKQTAAGIAVALESAGLLQSPEVAAEREQLRNDITGACLARWEEEQENARLRLALKSAQRGRQQLRARVAELEAERARYVGKEPTIAEEMAYLSRCIDSVLDLCEKAEQRGITSGGAFTVDAVRTAAEGMVGRTSYPPALPWARLMDDEDRAEFLADLADAVGHKDALVEIEDTCARWRAIAEAQHAHNTAPGPGEETR